MTFQTVWEKTLSELNGQISPNALKMWVESLKLVAYEDDAAVLLCQTTFQKDIVMSKYKDIISATMSMVVGFEISINVVTAEERRQLTPNAQVLKEPDGGQASKEFEAITASLAHPEYTFDNFIVGESNRHAHAACYAVANSPTAVYNPLFIYGPSGLGKTHLLFAIQNGAQMKNPNKVSQYIRSEDFTNELIDAIKQKTQAEFRAKYRNCDMLLIDDIQFISGKDSTQVEFFNTFETLYHENKQIIIVSDRPPKDIPLLDSRLRSRFEAGLMVSVGQPEFELKSAIIKQRCNFYQLDLSDEVIAHIAKNVKSNIRQIEGVLKKMMAYRLISNSTPNLAVAEAAISEITNENQPLPQLIDKILLAVSEECGVTIDELVGSRRMEKIANARHIAMYIMREITQMSLPEIGSQFNGRDHSTVHHAIERVEYKIKMNPQLRLRIDDMIKNIREG